MNLKPLALFSAFILLATIVGCASSGSTDSKQYEENAVIHQATKADYELAHSKQPITGDSVTLFVNGLGCPLCATNIDRQIERVPGVSSMTVDLSNGKVAVQLKQGGKRPTPNDFAEAVEEAGFTLVKVEL